MSFRSRSQIKTQPTYDELGPLSPDRLRRVFQESGPDFSAECILMPASTIWIRLW
jgi:hypothetical protein